MVGMATHTIAAGTTITAGTNPGFTLSVYGVADSTTAAYGALLNVRRNPERRTAIERARPPR
jgi:hypothetical protein